MHSTRLSGLLLRLSLIVGAATLFSAPDANAALSETGGSGIFELQSAESKRPGRLELGFFGAYRNLELGDSADTNLNTLYTGVNAAIGFGGGLEVSGSLPVYCYYRTLGSTGSPLEESVRLRLGDAAAQLRWTWPFLAPGMRLGAEGGARFPTGSDKEVAYPGRATDTPYTIHENNYFVRGLATWDGLRAGTGLPLRLHANGTYLFQRDESRFLLDRGPLALELPTPMGARDNDVLSLGGAVELDLSRVTLFGEIVTDQFVNERSLIKGKENRIAVTPGIRFWIPGGLSIAGGYTINLSEDDPATAFNPDRAFPDHEFRVALSLGTVFRSARAKAEDAVMARPLAVPAPSTEEDVVAAPVDSVAAKAAAKEKAILERRPIQEAPMAPKAIAAEPIAPLEPSEAAMESAPAAVPTPKAAPAPKGLVAPPAAPPTPAPAVPKAPAYADTDGDGIPDAHDECPLVAEDWDGFQDLDGCPDLDNDQDGIPDVRDQCPNDPETYNGYYDFDGCPDEAGQKWIERPSAGASEWKPRASAEGRIAPRDSIPRVSGDIAAPSAAAKPMVPAAPPPAATAAKVVTPTAPAPTPAPRTAATPARPAAAAPSGAAPSPADDARMAELAQRNDMLEARVRQMELELAGVSGRPPAGSPTATVIPMPSSGNSDLSARIASMEAELRAMRAANRSTGATTAAPREATKAAPSPAPPDTTSQRILERLDRMQEAIGRLPTEQTEAPEPPAAAEAEVAESAPAPEPSLASLDVWLPLGVPRVFPEIQFASNSAALTAAGLQAVSSLAAPLAAVPECRVTIIGHTDNFGDAAYNRTLSLERATTVAQALFAQGVGREQLTVDGRGEDAPIATNATNAGRAMNRRVEFLRTR